MSRAASESRRLSGEVRKQEAKHLRFRQEFGTGLVQVSQTLPPSVVFLTLFFSPRLSVAHHRSTSRRTFSRVNVDSNGVMSTTLKLPRLLQLLLPQMVHRMVGSWGALPIRKRCPGPPQVALRTLAQTMRRSDDEDDSSV